MHACLCVCMYVCMFVCCMSSSIVKRESPFLPRASRGLQENLTAMKGKKDRF
jgi:hypothetical protein